MAQIRQSKRYANYLKKLGWKIERIGKSQAFVRKIPLLGAAIKLQRPFDLKIDELKRLAEKYDAFQMIVEPSDPSHLQMLKTSGFRQGKSPFLPSKTIHLDLTKSNEALYEKFAKDTRYSIRKTDSLRVYSVDNIDAFRKSWKQAVGRRRHVPSKKQLAALKKSFNSSSQFLVTPSGSAGAIIIKSGGSAYYWQAFTSPEGRYELAQYKIVWSGIVWAKKEGAKVFDFEGIYDKRFPIKSWKGFTHFKKSFGGTEITFPGAFVKYRLL